MMMMMVLVMMVMMMMIVLDDDACMERKEVKWKVGAGEEEGVKKIQVEGGGEDTGAWMSGAIQVQGDHGAWHRGNVI